jgi:hypothetical protein
LAQTQKADNQELSMTWFWNWLIGNLVWTLLTSVVSLIFCRVTGRPTEISSLACGSFIVGILIASGFMWDFSAQANKAGFLEWNHWRNCINLAFGMVRFQKRRRQSLVKTSFDAHICVYSNCGSNLLYFLGRDCS